MMIRTAAYCLILLIAGCLIGPSSLPAETMQSGWKLMSRNLSDGDFRSVALPGDSSGTIYAAAKRAVYLSTDNGESWRPVFSLGPAGMSIHEIVLSRTDRDILLAGTDNGIYAIDTASSTSEHIFSRIGEREKSVLSVAVHPHRAKMLYAGTRSGLVLSDNGGKRWRRHHQFPSDEPVYCIVSSRSLPTTLYAAAGSGLLKSVDHGASWKNILDGLPLPEETTGSDEGETGDDDSPEEQELRISIAVSSHNADLLYAAMPQGIVFSDDGGAHWRMVSTIGLGSRAIRHMVYAADSTRALYAATERGIFRYSALSGAWEHLYRGMTSADARSLVLAGNSHPAVWAVTKKGLYQYLSSRQQKGQPDGSPSVNAASDARGILAAFAKEPSIAEIREAAIMYAEVHPEKIKQWRDAAARRAWLPEVRFGYSEAADWQRSDTYYKVNNAYRKYDDITRDNDSDWSVSLSWDLRDLVWNSSQTSIDTRSRLLVQLRDDILTEVTRLYFERRRLQVAFKTSHSVSEGEKIEQTLRMQELTAAIDALTGSYLSNHLARTGTGVREQH